MSVDLAGAGASCLCDGFGLRWFGSSLAWCVPVPRFRWLVCGSSLAGCLPVPREGFDFDLDLDFGLQTARPAGPMLAAGVWAEVGGAQWPHGVLGGYAGAVRPVCEEGGGQLLTKITSGGYDPGVTDARVSASLAAVGRVFRWRARTYRQAWLFAVLGSSLAGLIGFSFLGPHHGWGLYWPGFAIGCPVLLVGQGLALSYDVRRQHERSRRISTTS
jgi:hypothetical protein